MFPMSGSRVGRGSFTDAEVWLGEQSLVGQSAVAFTVPLGFRSVRFEGVVRTTATSAILQMGFNGDTGANYDNQRDYGNNGTASAAVNRGLGYAYVADMTGSSAPSGSGTPFAAKVFDVGGAFNKDVLGEYGLRSGATDATQYVFKVSCQWLNTAPITVIRFAPSSGVGATGSYITMVGIR